MSVEKLIRRGAAAGRMVDLVGVVTMHGRWEREGAWHFDQFWVRVWLQARDGHWILKIIISDFKMVGLIQ